MNEFEKELLVAVRSLTSELVGARKDLSDVVALYRQIQKENSKTLYDLEKKLRKEIKEQNEQAIRQFVDERFAELARQRRAALAKKKEGEKKE